MSERMIRRNRRGVISLTAAVLAVPMTTQPARAAIYYWNTGSGNWSTPGSWTNNTPPAGTNGVIRFNNSQSALCTVTLDVNTNVGFLYFTPSSATNTWAINSGGNFTLTLNNSGSNPTITNTLANSTVTIGAVIGGKGYSGTGVAFQTVGSGNISLTAINTYTGTVLLGGSTAGNLIINSDAALGQTSNTLELNENSSSLGLVLNSQGINIVNPVLFNQSSAVNTNGFDGTFSGTLSGTSSGTLNVTGGTNNGVNSSGSLTLSGNNTITSNFSVASDTTLIAASSSAFGTAGTVTAVSGGTIALSNIGTYASTGVTLSINNNGAEVNNLPAGALNNVAGYNTFNGPILLNGSGTSSSGKQNWINVTAGGLTLGGAISDNTSILSGLVKIGPGQLAIFGTNTYVGGTNVSAGTLIAGSTGAVAATAWLNVSSGARFNFYNVAGGTLNVGPSGAGKLYLQAGSSIGGVLGGTIQTSAATTFAGAENVDIYGAPAVTPTATPTAYTLVSATNGGLGNPTYQVGNIVNDTNFTVVGVAGVGGTSITATVAGVSPLTTAYWTGSNGNIWNLANGSTGFSSWSNNSAGTGVTALIPAATTDVIFSETLSASNQSGIVLGTSQTINSLTINDTTAVSLINDGNSLTIQGPGITLGNGAGLATLSDNIVLSGAAAVIAVNSSSGIIINGTLNSPNGLTTSGSGPAVYNGAVYAPNGLTTTGSAIATFNGAVNAPNGITTSGSATAIFNGSTSVAGTLSTTSPASVVLNGSVNAPSGLMVTGTGSATFNGGVNVAGGLTTGGSGTVTFNGVISGTTGLTATGPGNVLLNTANTYTGNTSVTGGSLILNQPSGTQTLLAAAGGGGFAGNLVVATPIRVNFDNGVFSGGGQIQVQTSGATLTNSNTAFGPGNVSNGIVLNSTGLAFTKGSVTTSTYTPGTFVTTIGGTNSSNTAASIIFSGVISGNSDVNIANSATAGGGSGTISLGSPATPGGSSGYDTYTGTTTINSNNATISLLNTNILPSTTDVVVGTQAGLGASILNINGFNQAIGSISDGVNVTQTAHNLTIVNNGSSPAILTIGNSVSPLAGSTAILSDGTSTLGLVKTGTDTITLLSSHCNYSGGLTVNQGALIAFNGGNGAPALGRTFVTVNPTGTTGTTADAATLNTSGPAIANATVLTVNSNSNTAIGTVNFVAGGPTIGSLSGNGNVVLANPSGIILQIGYTNNLSSTFSGVISDVTAGLGVIQKLGTGTLTLSGINTYPGLTNVSAGVLAIAPTGALASTSVIVGSSTAFNVSSGGAISPSTVLTDNGTVNFHSAQTVAVLNGSGGTLNLNGSTLTDINGGTFTGKILDGSAPGSVNLSGGTLTLSGSNSYSGQTLITGGMLYAGALNTLSANSAVNVSGGTLDAHAFNNSIASLTIGSGGTLNLGTGVILTDTGAANFGGTFNFVGTPALSEVLMTYPAGSQTGSFASTNLPGTERLSYTGGELEIVSAGPTSLFFNGAGTAWDTASANFTGAAGPTAYSDTSNGSTGDIVTFNDANNSGGIYNVVITSAGVHPGSVTFASSNSSPGYNISGGGIGGTGSVTLNSTGTVTISTANNYSGGTFVNNGALVLATPAALPANSNLSIGSVGTASPATVQLTAHTAGANAGLITLNQFSVSGTTNAWNGKLDLTNNAMVVHNGSLGDITNLAAQGFAGGTWNGTTGIVSTTAYLNPTHLTAIGVATGNVVGTIEGLGVTSTDVVVKYTYYGDANLDGQVSSADYTLIDAGYLSQGAMTGWQNGDFNYDGVINGSDYTLIDNAFNSQSGQLASQIANPYASATAQIAGAAATSAVPEPAGLAWVAISSIGMLRRRRR